MGGVRSLVVGALVALGLALPGGASPAVATVSAARVAKNPCRLVTRAQIASVLVGTTVERGRRSDRFCRWEFATPEELAGRLAVTTGLVRNASPGLVDDAVRLDEGLGLTTREVDGLGTRAVLEVEKLNLIVVTKRGNILEVQILDGPDPRPEVLEQQAVDLARLALARA